jgi:hypothetical protein
VFSDNDAALSAALISLPFDVTHVLCLFHLLDQSIKTVVGGCIVGGKSNWAAFRREFIKSRSAATEADCEEFFSTLVDSWLPEGVSTAAARKYMKMSGGGGGSGHRVSLEHHRQWEGRARRETRDGMLRLRVSSHLFFPS